MNRLRILTCCSVFLAALVFFFDHGAPTTVAGGKGLLMPKVWLANKSNPITPGEHARPPDQTFLTYPEWFLVFGPAEQADFFQSHTSTKFPFMVHVHQMWESYGIVNNQVSGNFPFNTGYHVMIVVIATSSTAEFGLKAAYETVIGRLTDTRDDEPMTTEDEFNAKFTRDYVQFLGTAPWYDFDFKSRLGKLWTETPLFGSHPLRKLERRYIFTTELAVKTVYGWLMGLGTHAAYELPKPTTAVVVDQLPAGIESKLPDLKVLSVQPDGSTIATLPRYAPFSSNACELALSGVAFKEVAGNSSAILITVLTPRDWSAPSESFSIIFTQPIPTKPGLKRVALATPVSELRRTLRQLSEQKLMIEHIYDF